MVIFMKFANVERVGYKDGKNRIGVGDYIQIIAIDDLYQEMGIKNDVINLDAKDMAFYSGETLILPINQLIAFEPWLDQNGEFSISKDIIPVFLGVSLREGFFQFTEQNIAFLKQYAPIGCRDYYTYQRVKQRGIPAYIAGCLTMTLPKRKDNDSSNKKVFLVDIPSRLKEYIPNNLLTNMERDIVHHAFEVSEDDFNDLHFAKLTAERMFDRYRREAALIITSRLHCASPCLAMGIPVIIAKQYRGYTFDWMEKFAPVFTEENYDKVPWNAGPIEIEEYKLLARKVAIMRLKGTCPPADIEELHKFHLSGYDDNYKPVEMPITHFVQEIEKRYQKNDPFDYAIWGVSNVADEIYEYLLSHYPKARMVKVIDSFSEKVFHGVVSEKPSVLKKNDPFITIVATINCMESAAKPLFTALGKDPSQYIYSSDTLI